MAYSTKDLFLPSLARHSFFEFSPTIEDRCARWVKVSNGPLHFPFDKENQLRHIPSVGVGIEIPILSFLSTFTSLFNANKRVSKPRPNLWEIYRLLTLTWFFSGLELFFKVPELFEWSVVGTGPKFIEEIYKVPERTLFQSWLTKWVYSYKKSISHSSDSSNGVYSVPIYATIPITMP